jgi:hypothetical protein
MRPAWRKGVRTYYAAIEECAGVLCPLLAVMSVVPQIASLQGVALVSLWIGCGHTLLHFYGLCPRVRYRPFLRGLFAFGAGVCWPIWFLARRPIGR